VCGGGKAPDLRERGAVDAAWRVVEGAAAVRGPTAHRGGERGRRRHRVLGEGGSGTAEGRDGGAVTEVAQERVGEAPPRGEKEAPSPTWLRRERSS
jgi:hypothetical protein